MKLTAKALEKAYGVQVTRPRRDTNWGSVKGYAAADACGNVLERGRDLSELATRLALRVKWGF